MLQLSIFFSVLVVSYLLINLILRKIPKRIFIPSGIEYIFLGIIIGPAFSNWFFQTFSIDFLKFTDNIFDKINIVVTLVLGLAGFIFGLNFNFAELYKSSKESLYIAITEIVVGIILAGIFAYTIFFYIYYDGYNFNEIITSVYIIGLAASVSSISAINSLIQIQNIKGELTSQIIQSSLLNINFVFIIYGLVFGLAKVESFTLSKISFSEWILIGAALIAFLGFLFFVFLEKEYDESKIIIAVSGIIFFTSGIAYSLGFSPIFMNFILGLIISNSSKIRSMIKNSMQKLLPPLNVLILIFAGYFWMPTDLITFIISAVLFIIIRYLVKILTGKFSYLMNNENQKMEPTIGKALLSMETIFAALIVDFINSYQTKINPVVMSAVFSGMIYFSIIGYNSLRKFLIDAGEFREEMN